MPKHSWFGLLRVRSPLLAQSLLFSPPTGTKMFQFPAFAPGYCRVSRLQRDGFPHSDICGSPVICTSPQLFAAYHVLLRLREPRHPPCALAYFLSETYRSVSEKYAPFVSFALSSVSLLLPFALLYSFLSCFSICQRPYGVAEWLYAFGGVIRIRTVRTAQTRSGFLTVQTPFGHVTPSFIFCPLSLFASRASGCLLYSLCIAPCSCQTTAPGCSLFCGE